MEVSHPVEEEEKQLKFVTKQVEVNKKSGEETYRASFTNEEEALEWLRLHQRKTRTHWVVNKTFPDPER